MIIMMNTFNTMFPSTCCECGEDVDLNRPGTFAVCPDCGAIFCKNCEHILRTTHVCEDENWGDDDY